MRTLEHLKARMAVIGDAVSDIQTLANALANDNFEKTQLIKDAAQVGRPGSPERNDAVKAALEQCFSDEQVAQWFAAFSAALVACHTEVTQKANTCETKWRGPEIVLPDGFKRH